VRQKYTDSKEKHFLHGKPRMAKNSDLKIQNSKNVQISIFVEICLMVNPPKAV